MARTELILGDRPLSVLSKSLSANCQTFGDDPSLLEAAYRVRSSVDVDTFYHFVRAIEGAAPEITHSNASDLAALCDEFGFLSLAMKVWDFRSSPFRPESPPVIVFSPSQRLHQATQQQQLEIVNVRGEMARLGTSARTLREQSRLLEDSNQQLGWRLHSLEGQLDHLSRQSRQISETNKNLWLLLGIGQGSGGPPFGHNRNSFQYDTAAPLCGIIADLTEKTEGNVHEKGVVNITSKTTQDVNSLKEIVNLQANTYFWSRDGPGQWICLDFRAKRVQITQYAIRSSPQHRRGSHHLRSWVLEVSQNGTNWTLIDRHWNDTELNNKGAIKNCHVIEGPPIRFVRLRQTGPNHADAHYLILGAIEFFGRLFDD
jgi:hypothetical protein